MFNEFIEKKQAKKFNDELIDATKGYSQLMQIETDHGDQIFKIVINPDSKKTICFVGGSEKSGSSVILEFIKNKFHVPKSKKLILLPLAKNHHIKDIFDAIKDDYMILFCDFQETQTSNWSCHTELKDLANDLTSLAKKYFNISDYENESSELENKICVENGISYIVVKIPGKTSTTKLKEYGNKMMKLIINSAQ